MEKVNVTPPCRSKTHKLARGESRNSGVMEFCNSNCSVCGFNPAVSKKRLERGRWEDNGIMKITEFKDASMNIEKSYFVEGLHHLVFPSGITANGKNE